MANPTLAPPPDALLPEVLQQARSLADAWHRELQQEVIGVRDLADQLLIALLCDAHVLLDGMPGLAKTTLVRALAHMSGLSFRTIRLVPGSPAAALVGTLPMRDVCEAPDGTTESTGQPDGPLFAEVVLADGINFWPPELQVLLLEAMDERYVSRGSRRFPLPSPFLVVASRIAVEGEPPHPLLEAQLDRFMFRIDVPFPDYATEFHVGRQLTGPLPDRSVPRLTPEAVRALQRSVRQVHLPPPVVHFALRLVRATRVHECETPDFILEWVTWGVGPRGLHWLLLGAKARALLAGRDTVTADDVAGLALPIFRHRLLTNRNATANGIGPDDIIRRLLYEIPRRAEGDEAVPELA